MSEFARTLVYGIVAAASVGLAWTADRMTRPAKLEQFGEVGTEFYPDFKNPGLAKSLRVVAFDDGTASIDEFSINQRSTGDWIIPSHFDYPADAEDRLADTATSILHIERDLLASRYEADHERLSVIDPLDEDQTKITGRGERITLNDANDKPLCDLIIGKESEDREGYYYVRMPDDDKTYLSKLEIDLSTKFGDWIEPDLLKVDSFKLSQIVIDRYSIDEQRGRIVTESVSTLNKEDSKWVLEDLKDDEEMRDDDIREMVSSLDDLKIVGVRPKPEGLNADLTVDAKIARNPLLFEALRSSLISKGYFVQPGKEGGTKLYSNEGQLIASTNEGIVYNLYFGEVFTGSDEEIETGFSKSDEDKAAEEASSDDDEATEEEDGEADSNSSSKRSRYLFVSTRFDESYLDDKPVEPIEPPEFDGAAGDGNAAEESADNDSGTEKTDADDAAEPVSNDDQDGDKSEDSGETEGDGKAEAAKKARDEYEVAKKKYERDMETWNEKVEEGKKTSDDLNARFAEWYYVISAESFDKLRLARADLVQPKEEEEDSDEASTDEPASSTDAAQTSALTEPGDATESSDSGETPSDKAAADESAAPASEPTEDAPPANDGDGAAASDPPAESEDPADEPASNEPPPSAKPE